MAASISAVAAICSSAPATTQGQKIAPGIGGAVPDTAITPARKSTANGRPNRKRTWVAPTVPSSAVNPRWVALRTVCAAAAMMVKKAHSHEGSDIARLLGDHHVVHVHIAGEAPAVREELVVHSGLVNNRETAI